MRSLLLRASRSPWLADQFRRRAFAARAVRRFMPGEDASAALDAAGALVADGMGTVLTCLGEQVTTPAEAAATREHYLRLLDAIHERGLPAHISVKLSHLGVELDAEGCGRSLSALASRAEETGSFLWIDMEESHYVDRTLALFRRVRAEHDTVGICLQSYLLRTPADLESLLPLTPAIRLVKGAYREPPEVAFAKKRDTDTAYLELADRLLERAAQGGVFPVFGTHDPRLIERIRTRAEALGLAPDAAELHMLYGIRMAEQQALARSGVRVRALISYGENWFPWYMRRLAERPANVWFVLKQMIARPG